MKDIPVYRFPAEHARENGELELYRASNKANTACKEAIEKAISEHYCDNVLHREAVAQVAEYFAGERDACKSHGIYRIAGLLRTIRAGKVSPNARPTVSVDGTAIVRVAAHDGFACLAFDLGLPALVERSRALGLAAMVITDCTHFAALWPEVEALTDHG